MITVHGRDLWAVFYVIGNSVGIAYYIKSLTEQERTAAERVAVARGDPSQAENPASWIFFIWTMRKILTRV